MFEFKKSRYPNLWFLLKLGTICHDSWNKKPKDMCSLIRKCCLGVLFSVILSFIVSFCLMVALEPFARIIMYAITGYASYSDYFFLEGLIGSSVVFYCIAAISYCFYLDCVHDIDIYGKIDKILSKFKTNKEPGILSVWYKGFKEKYCPTVTVVEDVK